MCRQYTPLNLDPEPVAYACYTASVLLRAFPILLLLSSIAGCSERPQILGTSSRDLSADLWGQVDKTPFFWPDAGDLNGGDKAPVGTDRCVGASQVTFTAGKATLSGTTSGANNEFAAAIRCGGKIPLVGPQRYHTVTLTRGMYYRFTLIPQFKGALYLFSECSQNIINSDCSSGGQGGSLAGPVTSAGASATITFTPDATGTYYLAVDSAAVADAGTYSLQIEELGAPTNGTCSKAQALTFSSGSATVKGTTLGAANEFSSLITCGLGVKFQGPQVYYSVSLTKGLWYRFTLDPDFSAALWLANTKGGCQYSNINVDCGGIGGTVLPLVSKGATGQTAFSPSVSGSYILAVGSLTKTQQGNFTLKVESFTPADNAVCAGASKVTLSGGKGTANGATSGAINDRGAHVTCGALPPLVGGQRYHTVDLLAKPYRLQLKPTFAAVFALGQSCLTLPADCSSSGLSGGAVSVGAGSAGTILFAPGQAGTYVLAVDSATVTGAGTYELQIQEDQAATNGACGTPGDLTLGQSPASELGDTSPLKNDLQGITCGLASGPWAGPGAYYKVKVLTGKTYTVTLTPESTFDAALYAFPSTTACTAAAVNAACKGMASDLVGAGKSETLTLIPAANTDMILVVDSWNASEVGRYTLTVAWK